MLQMVGSLNRQMNKLKTWFYSFNRSYTNGGPEHAAASRGTCPHCTRGKKLFSLPYHEPSV